MLPAQGPTSMSMSTSLPDTAIFSDAKAQHPDKVFIAPSSEGESDGTCFTVDFEGEGDESNPVNWPLWYKWSLIIVLSSVNTIA